MKIGILTFHCAINYGAVLQAYALQEYFKKLGHEVYIIDYQPNYLLAPYRVFHKSYCPKGCNPVKWLLRDFALSLIRYKRRMAFHRFWKNNLNLLNLDLNSESNDIDMFIFGSDQIWNTNITQGLDRIYLGDFPASRNKKLIAYAASMGGSDKETINLITPYLEHFDAISVREKKLKSMLELGGLSVSLVLDPTLLVDNSCFYSLTTKIDRPPYLLVFEVYTDQHKKVMETAHHIAQKLNLEVVEIYATYESLRRKKETQSLTPEKFLSYISNASYIITTSFHGTVFAILFGKPFYTVSINETVDQRVLSLLKSLSIEERLLKDSINVQYSDVIDYDKVNRKLALLRDESRKFIDNNINKK